MTINKIKLETNFYAAFRNTVRIILNKLSNLETKEEIIKIINEYDLFKEKLSKIIILLKEKIQPYVTFVEFDEKTIEMFTNIGLCIETNKDGLDTGFCFVNETTGIIQLKIPKYHLISGFDNEELYFSKLSDELIRYNKIRNYILEKNIFLNLTDTPYNLHDNEIILPESIISKEYFDDIKISISNVKMNKTYDTLMYSDTKTDVINENRKLPDESNIVLCKKTIDTIKKRNVKPFWKYFEQLKRTGYICSMLTYTPNSIMCIYQIMIDIINDKINKTFSILELKNIIIEKIVLMNKKNSVKLTQLLKSQGKKYMFKPPFLENFSISEKILDEKYYLTNIDISILCEHFNLDLIILSGSSLFKLKENNKDILTFKYGSGDFYYILRQVKIDLTPPQKYNLFTINNKLKFMSDMLNPKFQSLLTSFKY